MEQDSSTGDSESESDSELDLDKWDEWFETDLSVLKDLP